MANKNTKSKNLKLAKEIGKMRHERRMAEHFAKLARANKEGSN